MASQTILTPADTVQQHQSSDSVTNEGGWLYNHLFKASTQLPYDTRIDDYNWIQIIGIQCAAYFVLHILVRLIVPSPGKKEDFIARKKLREYYFYYFQYTSLFHALVCIFVDPFIFYYGGYRYNQPNHLYYVFILSHSFAYFIFDTIIEIFYRTDDALTNVHHAVCLAVSYFGIRAPHSAFEFVVLQFLAETSNPFLIYRTILRIQGKKDTNTFRINEFVFAGVFIIARVILTPMFLVYMYEGYNVLYSIKLGVSLILFVQLMWAYRIIELVFQSIRVAYEKKEATPPSIVVAGESLMNAVQNKKKVAMGMAFFNFCWIFVLPHVYYGVVLKNLHFNLIF
ncbi:hypothetical protein FGO68_gene3429 [Halteria grandinella]|uniref:TLC domain-containing protein n=1 Tax=Halteria grandinella TaxID=5974 RepID=A0A8J8NPA5_HALGN|nr:hypothetical protein FGO68_gene3429 [Halteria grandinella]